MLVSEKTLTFDRTLWVQYAGVEVQESGGQISIIGRDEDSYLKVLNHFGRVLRLFTFEGGRWVDANTGGAAEPFDDSQAGHLPSPGAAASPPSAATSMSTATRHPKPASRSEDKRKDAPRRSSTGKVSDRRGSRRTESSSVPNAQRQQTRRPAARSSGKRGSGKKTT